MAGSALVVPTGLRDVSRVRVELNELIIEPIRRRVGDLAPLMEDIAQRGTYMYAVAVQRRPGEGPYTLLAGERRIAAVTRLGWQSAEVYLARDWNDFLWWMSRDQVAGRHWATRANRHGAEPRPVTPMEALAFSNRVVDLLSPPYRSRYDDAIGEYLGVSGGYIQEARTLAKWLHPTVPEQVRQVAIFSIAEVEAGKMRPSSAHARVKRVSDALARPPMPVSQQRKLLSNTAGLMAGVTDGLRNLGDLSSELESGECADYIDQLSAARRELERVIRQLKERVSE